jgi:stearoyl-CoA desaturase (Delta-9 desaturase)
MNPISRPKDEQFNLKSSTSFILMHLVALPILWTMPTKAALLTLFFTFFGRMFGITGGFHRYFSHKTYKTSRVFQFFMAFLGGMSAQKGALWWAAHHRHHHRHSDQPEDIHSPTLKGFWWSHLGWIVCDKYIGTQSNLIPDLMKYPELRFLSKYHLLPPTILGVALFFLGGWNVFLWGFLLSNVLLWHSTFTINSLSHVFGTRRYDTTDTSRNNFLLAILTMGEGWHNNHHHYMQSTRQGFYWWEIDVTYYLLFALSKIGIVWDLRGVPEDVLKPAVKETLASVLEFTPPAPVVSAPPAAVKIATRQ